MERVSFLPLQHEHLRYMTPHIDQQTEYEALLEPSGESLVFRSFGLSAWLHGRCVGIGGVCRIWPGRAEAWGLFGAGIGRHIIPVARHVKYIVDRQPYRRLEMTVKVGNVAGNRIARLLGFDRPECTLRAYHPDGSDMYMYARIKPWLQ